MAKLLYWACGPCSSPFVIVGFIDGMSVELLFEQALQEGRFSVFAGSAFADEGAVLRAHEILLERLAALQQTDLPAWEPLEQAVQESGELLFDRRDANVLYFCDQLFEHCQAQTDLEPALLAAFLHLRPLLAVVMLRDKAALHSFQHPLYQLLDQLWDAARYWSPELGRQGEKYCARLSDMLASLRIADAVTTPFQAWLDDLSAQLHKDSQRADLLATRISQAERGTLAGQLAERFVRRHLNQLLLRSDMPEAVELLLKGPFRHSLQVIFLNYGADSDAWREAISTAEILQDSMRPPSNEEEKQRVYQLIPKMPSLLSRQLISIGDQAELDEWLGQIEKLHMHMLLDGKIEVRPAEPLSMLGDVEGVSANISAALLSQVALIPEGQWLIYQKENGESMRCRLALKMEDAEQLLFVNILGAKCLEKSLEEFAYLLAARHLRLLNADNNFSQILRDTVGHFLQLNQKHSLLAADAAERQRLDDKRRQQAQAKARREAERLAQERLAAQLREEEHARLLAEQAAAHAAVEAQRSADEMARVAEEAARFNAMAARLAERDAQQSAADEAQRAAEAAADEAQRVAAEAARQKAEAARERERELLEEKQSRINQWEEVLQTVRTLGVGAWVEIDIDGTRQKCKLAAVINASDKLIFVGRDGRKLAEPRRDELIKLILDGKAAIIERGDQFENSLAKVIQTLRQD